MKLFVKIFRTQILFISAVIYFSFTSDWSRADSDSNIRPDDAPEDRSNIAYQQILPRDQILKFQQVEFRFEFGKQENSNWGRIEVYPKQLEKYSDSCAGYINVWLESAFLEEPQRVVADLYIPANHGQQVCSLEDPTKRMEREGDSTRSSDREEIPFTRFFDINPGGEGNIVVDQVKVLAFFSRQPAAHQLEQISLVYQNIEFKAFAVVPRSYNAQGGFTYLNNDDPLPTPEPDPDTLINFGPPPPVSPIPLDFDLLTFPVTVDQEGEPNLEAAWNQCFPIAVSNTLGFLERSYDSEQILKWELQHQRGVRGIGLETLVGDIPTWSPVPANSLVANVDTFTRRGDVKNADVGRGTNGCTLHYGIFGYLAEYGEHAPIVFRHQDGDDIIDPDALVGCPTAPFDVGDRVSVREGLTVTWEWVFEQLSKGRGVFVGVTWYSNGEAVGGHGMRVRGASRINGRTYFTFVNDSQQGSSTGGLEYPTVEVSDVRGPALQVVPNGKLELDRGQHEISFAMSFEAVPTVKIFQ